ncbi:adhesion G protein-coupled receptor E5 [Bufo bufo]|uniref:adhesion G protein-coupled receptor E5 n=1 Tax=Bufo bufo TaxID=8384 RepID=UPI001ABEB32B|nr:adhesion G protein-coupled receptor E5 [Bufo bufo]
MPRFWNTGICLMALLVHGATSQMLNCPIGTLPPNTTNCTNRICPEGQQYNASFPCIPGYKEEIGECVDILECVTGDHMCGANSKCKNTRGSYYCMCNAGYRKGNQTAFCPYKDGKENVCTDIDECSENPGICDFNKICKNTLGSYQCICKEGFVNISNSCVEIQKCKAVFCGLKGICVSKANTISCSCQEGYRAISLGLQHPQCNVNCKYKSKEWNCANESFQCHLNYFTDQFTPFCENVTRQNNLSFAELLKGLDRLIDEFRYDDKTARLQKAGRLLEMVESRVKSLALLEQKEVSHVNMNETIRILVSSGPSDSGLISLQSDKINIKLDSKTAAGETDVALLGCLEYTNISHILKGADLLGEKSKSKRFKMVSPVVSVFLGISNTSSLRHPVSMRLNFTDEVKSPNISCVSWSVSDSSWTSKGCVMVERDDDGITCNCTHLTSFAILMLLDDYESWALTLLTQIGLSISIFCLVLAIITFCFCRSIRGTRNTIHMHLCISLFFGNCIFLLGIEATHNKVACGIVAGLLHAFYLSSFCWMSLEGLELYRMLVTVFKTHLKKRYLLAVGYGTPAVIITISAAIYHKGYGTEKYCWLSREKGFIWAFMGPVCLIILVNCGIFVLTVWKLAEKMSSINPEQGQLKRIRTLTMTSLAQLCILGSCWAFGFFMFNTATPFFIYAFTILNTLQGLQIFCLHCLMHKKVREEYKMWLCALAHFKTPVYSEFSNTSNSQTHTKGKTSKDSGL